MSWEDILKFSLLEKIEIAEYDSLTAFNKIKQGEKHTFSFFEIRPNSRTPKGRYKATFPPNDYPRMNNVYINPQDFEGVVKEAKSKYPSAHIKQDVLGFEPDYLVIYDYTIEPYN